MDFNMELFMEFEGPQLSILKESLEGYIENVTKDLPFLNPTNTEICEFNIEIANNMLNAINNELNERQAEFERVCGGSLLES